MKKYFEIIRACPLFCDIADENLMRMLSCFGAKINSFKKRQYIISEGEKATHVGIILTGRAIAVQIDYFGNRSIVSEIQQCETFAEGFAYTETKTVPISIIADEDCDVMFIDSIKITQPCCNACDFHKQIIFNLMRSLANKNAMFHRRIEITSKRSTREKLLAFLFMQAKSEGKSSFDIRFDRQALADYLEVDRSGLSSEIGKLRKEGIIKSDRNHFELLNCNVDNDLYPI